MERPGNSGFSVTRFEARELKLFSIGQQLKLMTRDFLSYDLYLELNRAFRHIRLRIVLAPLEIGI